MIRPIQVACSVCPARAGSKCKFQNLGLRLNKKSLQESDIGFHQPRKDLAYGYTHAESLFQNHTDYMSVRLLHPSGGYFTVRRSDIDRAKKVSWQR